MLFANAFKLLNAILAVSYAPKAMDAATQVSVEIKFFFSFFFFCSFVV